MRVLKRAASCRHMQVYALVGVAGMLAANCRVPLTSVLLLFELTRDYALILPTLAAVGLSFWAVQYCLRALAAVVAYSPDFGGEPRWKLRAVRLEYMSCGCIKRYT